MKLLLIPDQVLVVIFVFKGTAGSCFGDFPSPSLFQKLPGSTTGAEVIAGKNHNQEPISHIRAEMTQKSPNPPSAHDYRLHQQVLQMVCLE